MRLGVLTGGGDCPGLNAAIRAVVAQALARGHRVVGFARGWAGVMEGNHRPLRWSDVQDIICVGGTVLGTSRTNPFSREDGPDTVREVVRSLGLDCLIVIGGDDTLGAAGRLVQLGVPCIGVPKTMDNDVWGTDYTIGFHTAATTATEAVERLHTTASSHRRVMLLEVMGRDAGWVAFTAGVAGGAHLVLIPEQRCSLDDICGLVDRRVRGGEPYTLIVCAEGVQPEGLEQPSYEERGVDEFGHVRLGGIGQVIADAISARTGHETRATILGYLQRGGWPTMFDRMLGTRFGTKAAELAGKGETGLMVALRGRDIITVPLEDVTGRIRTVEPELYTALDVFLHIDEGVVKAG